MAENLIFTNYNLSYAIFRPWFRVLLEWADSTSLALNALRRKFFEKVGARDML